MDTSLEEKIINHLMKNLTTQDIDLEIGRFITENDIFQDSNSLHVWIIKQNSHQITEKTVELDEFSSIEINLTFVPPNFFTDVFEGLDVPYWQIATSKRVLTDCKIVYDPQKFVHYCIEQAKTLSWNSESIALKKNVSEELISKARNFIKQDMLADAYMWAIKAVEEAICVQLMNNGSFNVTTPSLLLDSIRGTPDLIRFYSDLLAADLLTPDLAFVSLKELENLAEYLYHSQNIHKQREEWILSAFVSINEAERKLKRVLNHASDENLDLASWEIVFEDALAELWQAYFVTAQTPWNKDVPLDPWVVGLFWKWFVNEEPKYDVNQILERTKAILETGSPLFEWEQN